MENRFYGLHGAANGERQPARLWLALDGPDVIELKRIVAVGDQTKALEFFDDVIVLGVMAGAERCGIDLARLEEGGGHGSLSG
jgi:hypothetical protein